MKKLPDQVKLPPKEPRYDGSWLVGVVVAVAMVVVVVEGGDVENPGLGCSMACCVAQS